MTNKYIERLESALGALEVENKRLKERLEYCLNKSKDLTGTHGRALLKLQQLESQLTAKEKEKD